MNDEPQQATYEITGPDEQGVIRLKMPNLDPSHEGEFFCISLGTDTEAIAEAMCQWISKINYRVCD